MVISYFTMVRPVIAIQFLYFTMATRCCTVPLYYHGSTMLLCPKCHGTFLPRTDHTLVSEHYAEEARSW